ncbi:MAG: hypothetical protein ABUS57_11450, partial [Pseudomonadota bacterium]
SEHNGPAHAANEAREAFSRSTNEGCAALSSLIFWGGAGSAADVIFSRENLRCQGSSDALVSLLSRPDSAFREANAKLASLLIDLAEHYTALCHRVKDTAPYLDRAAMIAATLRRWQKDGLV